MAKKQQPSSATGLLFGGSIQPDLFNNGSISRSTLEHPIREKKVWYYYIDWLNAANGHKQERKTMLNEFGLAAWGRATLPNFSMDMVHMTDQPTKYPCVDQHNASYWAEPNDLDNGNTFCVIFQADGYPATEGYREWFGRFEDADEVARLLASGEDL